MAVKNYAGAKEIALTADETESFEAGVSLVKAAIKNHGYSQEAVDNLKFALTKHTLEISSEEGRSGAFHTQADGKPFYAINLTAPGSFMEMNVDASKKQTDLPAKTQSQLLAFEIGLNLFGHVEKVIAEKYGVKEEGRGGGAGMPVAKIEIETTTRHDPFMFMMALTDLVNYRLNMLEQEYAAKTGAPKAPKASGLGM